MAPIEHQWVPPRSQRAKVHPSHFYQFSSLFPGKQTMRLSPNDLCGVKITFRDCLQPNITELDVHIKTTGFTLP